MFSSSLAFHHSALLFGRVLWMGHPCQKHPSTKTAIFWPRKIISAYLFSSFNGATWTRKRIPSLWRAERISSSLFVPLWRTFRIRLLATSEELAGRSLFALKSKLPINCQADETSVLINGLPNATPIRGGTALPIIFAQLLREDTLEKEKKSGNVWSLAASCGVKVLRRLG
jgi:hypothetical protein